MRAPMLVVTMEGEHSACCRGAKEVAVTGRRCSSTKLGEEQGVFLRGGQLLPFLFLRLAAPEHHIQIRENPWRGAGRRHGCEGALEE